MPTLRLHDDDGNHYDVDVDDEEDDEEEDDEEGRKDFEWLRARRKEWESSQSSKTPKVRRVKTSSQKPPQKSKQARRVLRIA